MNKTDRLAMEYLKRYHNNITIDKNNILTADGKRYVAKKIYGNNTIWLYKKQMEKLKIEGIDIIAVNHSTGQFTILNHKDISCNTEVNGIRIVCPEKVTIKVDESIIEKLKNIDKNPEVAIRTLLERYEHSTHDIPGLTNEFLPLILAISVAKGNNLTYYKAIDDIINGNYNISKDVLESLIKHKIIYYDPYSNEIKLLSMFKQEIADGKIRIYVAYNTNFCRMFCSNINTCTLFLSHLSKSNEERWFGNIYEFTIDEFEKSSLEELIGKCVMRCVRYEDK